MYAVHHNFKSTTVDSCKGQRKRKFETQRKFIRRVNRTQSAFILCTDNFNAIHGVLRSSINTPTYDEPEKYKKSVDADRFWQQAI